MSLTTFDHKVIKQIVKTTLKEEGVLTEKNFKKVIEKEELVTETRMRQVVEAVIDAKIEEKGLVTKDYLHEQLKHLPTKDEFYETMDKVMGELKTIRDELTYS